MKHIFSAAIILASGLLCTAGTLSPEQAWTRAINRDGTQRIAPASSIYAQPALAMTGVTESGQPAYYVFTPSDRQDGFTIVSADDRAFPLLGYTDKGTFDPDNMPENLKWWLGEYAREIESAPASMKPFNSADVHTSALKAISPRLHTAWDQLTPYNDNCPVERDKRCYTGCTATAMAQIMRYHRWPESGLGYTEYTRVNIDGIRDTLSYDYENARFDWASMRYTYNNDYTEAEAAAVANIMYAAGVSVHTSYHSVRSGSSANTFSVPNAFAQYFRYDKSLTWRSRDIYPLPQWEEMIYNSLANNMPVFYCGSNDDAGHAFVCDGYSDGFFHFNWGWSGISDGYYRLSALNPPAQGAGGSRQGYNFNQGAIIGIQPDKGTESPTPVMECQDILTASVNKRALSFAGRFINLACGSVYYRLGVRFHDVETGQDYYAASYTRGDLEPHTYYASFSVVAPTSLAKNATYHVYPVYANVQNPQSESEWIDIPTIYGTPAYAIITDTEGEFTIEMPETDNLSVTDIEILTPLHHGSAFKIRASLRNDTEADIHSRIQPVFVDDSLMVWGFGSAHSCDISPMSTAEVEYESTLQVYQGFEPGEYRLIFINATTGAYISEPVEVILDKEATDTRLSIDWNIDGDLEDIDASAITIKGDITCHSGYFGAAFTLLIFPNSGGTNVGSIFSPTYFVNPDETVTFSFSGPFPEAVIGESYFAMLYLDGSPVNPQKTHFTVSKKSAIESVKADEEMTLESIWTADGRRLSTESADVLPAGLYIMRYSTVSGDITTRKVMIK